MSKSAMGPRALVLLVASCLVTVLAVACGGDENDGSLRGGDVGNIASGPCEADAQRQCGRTLKQGDGIKTCFRGVQYCEEGTWGPCVDGEISEEADTQSYRLDEYGLEVVSGVTPTDCVDPCDPRCMEFIETPGGLGGAPSMGPGGVTNYTPPGCDHELCDEGAALDAACDGCVAAVCAVDPACCSVDWNDDCVAKTFTVCENQPPPLGLCDFGLFTEQSLTTANRPASGTAIGANANITIGTDAAPSSIIVGGNLTIQSPNGATVDTPDGVWVGGDIVVQAGSSTNYNGNWNAGGSITLNGGNSINGDVYSGFNIDGQLTAAINGDAFAGSVISSNVAVSGTPTPGSTHAPPVVDIPTMIPERTVSCGGTNYTINGGTQTLPPGNYGTITLQNSATLILAPEGDYTFQAINGGSATGGGIQLGTSDYSGTGWDVSICGNFSLGNNLRVTDHLGAVLADPKEFVAYVGGNVTFGTDVKFAGVLMVPNGTYTGADRASVNGALWAETINAGTDLNATGINKDDCEALGITTPPAITNCPVQDVVSEPLLNEPCETGRDCQINHRCEPVSTGGTCSHSVCTTGMGLSPTCGDECVERICAVNAGCCDVSTPSWTSACVDLVATVCDAQCGLMSTGTCVSNRDGFQDATCAGYDLALDFPCDDSVFVCNHGSVDFSGTVEVGYWEAADAEASTASPDLASMDGSCSQALAIPAGDCATMTCPIPAGDHTLMVDPSALLSECNSRRLDNWSWDDGGSCAPSSTMVEFEYEADCPDDSVAKWKNLTWVTSTPGSSRVEFSARVGESFGDLTAQPFTLVGTAEAGSPDTQVCSLAGPSGPCPVPLTTTLGLGDQQGQFLGLRVDATTVAGSTPTVTDWEISYTCVFDQ